MNCSCTKVIGIAVIVSFLICSIEGLLIIKFGIENKPLPRIVGSRSVVDGKVKFGDKSHFNDSQEYAIRKISGYK